MNNSRIHLKPQEEWGWQVAIYLYLAGLGAGALAIGLLVNWLGYSPYSTRTLFLWGPILVTIGAPFLILKLGIKRRFLNTILNPRTSWLSRGFYILSLCIIVGLAILGISILPFLGINISNWSSLLLILDIIGFVLALATAIYTGILIQAVKYVPFWNTPLLPALFTVSALSTGSMGIILSVLGYSILTSSAGYPAQLMDLLIRTEQVLMLIEALVLGLYLFLRYKAEEEGKSSVRLLLSGDLKFVFWIGIIVSGFFFPIILEGIYSQFHEHYFLLFITGASLLIGGFFLRYGVVYAGIKEQHPLQKLMEDQYYLEVLK
ncbi:NrfD/PsrC family molybdoenzyme membrane anchor subunit [Chloroflexota bacterium]